MLQKAMEGTRQIDLQRLRQSNLEGSLSLFREKSKRVIQSVNEWSKHRVLFRLQDLVEKIYQLSNVHGLQQMLELIPSGPTKIIKESVFATALLNIIWKVSRYQEAAQVLHRIAKKFPVVRTIELRLATLPPEAFDRPHYPNYSPSLSTALSRLGKIEGKQYRLTQVSQFMTSDKTKNPNDQFAEQTTKTLQEAKIHAEVQLLAYCEIQSPPLFPRAIGSSKDACFLCHALIQRHGKMHTSRTHGRLYPGWRLPLLLSFKTLEHQFNQVLQNHARQTIQARAQGQASARPQPNESTLLPMVVSASTLTAIPDPIEVTQIISEHEAVVSSVSPIPAVVESEVSITNPPEMKTPPVEIETYLRALVRESAGEVVLAASEPFTGILSPTASSPLFLAGPLHVHLEMEASSTCEAAKCLAYSIERIAIDQVLELPAETLTVNVVDLEREVTYALPADGTFRITACDVAVQVGCESSS
ncbi:hypothetical protein N7462_001773 [Penicillium macrosclerotiorum]|uniref:uncharacterized protein n=1 Tax=Penicillium macrosclerotiorum TaxID=303699 RepID=UPI0025493760|nr:uncharacterized protein N7462_001773 [Penicillium macrosclerotiorum]KAJ5692350.1 hypothetical protein N7462_001773 [Penicillium macrosclerotiorum]